MYVGSVHAMEHICFVVKEHLTGIVSVYLLGQVQAW